MIVLVPEHSDAPAFEPSVRRDKRGRRIGRNWWREWIMEEYRAAEAAWFALRESGQPINTGAVAGADYDTAYYQLSDEEYQQINPRPTLRMFLETNAGMAQYQAA